MSGETTFESERTLYFGADDGSVSPERPKRAGKFTRIIEDVLRKWYGHEVFRTDGPVAIGTYLGGGE